VMLNMAAFETPSPKTLARAAKVQKIVRGCFTGRRPNVSVTQVGHRCSVKVQAIPEYAALIRVRLDMAHIDADVTVYGNHIHITIMGV
jgi:hypothetical protein